MFQCKHPKNCIEVSFVAFGMENNKKFSIFALVWYNRILVYIFLENPSKQCFSIKIALKSDSILSSCGFKVICSKPDSLKFFWSIPLGGQDIYEHPHKTGARWTPAIAYTFLKTIKSLSISNLWKCAVIYLVLKRMSFFLLVTNSPS